MTKTISIQADASNRSLCTCLLQEEQPITFVSKSITYTETHSISIEMDLLAVLYACMRFHTHLYGRSFTVGSDCKPQKMITMRNLIPAPTMLQWMLLHLHYIIILLSLWDSYLRDIHQDHQGISRCQQMARDTIYLPGIDGEINDYVKRCEICIKAKSSLPTETYSTMWFPKSLLLRVGADFFE